MAKRQVTPLAERFARYIRKPDDLLGCWQWVSALSNGYGVIGRGGRGQRSTVRPPCRMGTRLRTNSRRLVCVIGAITGDVCDQIISFSARSSTTTGTY